MRKVGRSPSRVSMTAIIEVVVVFPCVPATAIERRPRISAARIWARMKTGMPLAAAPATSAFDAGTAEEMTTASGVPTCSAR